MSTSIKSIKIQITEPCLIAQEGKETIHAKTGETYDLSIKDALDVVSSGRAVPVTKLPNALKGEGEKSK